MMSDKDDRISKINQQYSDFMNSKGFELDDPPSDLDRFEESDDFEDKMCGSATVGATNSIDELEYVKSEIEKI